MKIKLVLNRDKHDAFYRNEFKSLFICEEFVQTEFGIIVPDNILVEINTVRPHQKNWIKLEYFKELMILSGRQLGYVMVTKHKKIYDLLWIQQKQLDKHNIENFWIKITPIN